MPHKLNWVIIMDELVLNFKKKRRNYNGTKKNIKKNKKNIYITQILLGIILFLVSIIYIKSSDKNLLLYKEYVFTESLPFTKIKNIYENMFGEVIPKGNQDKTVFSGSLVYKNIEDYLDGEKLTVSPNSLITNLNGGIVVYIGEKEDYGNTVIVQGNDGADIWYGNIANVNVKLYDYIEKDTTIGETIDDILYLVIKKNNEYLKYEEYKN